jgi:hypothetical protein
MDGCNALGWYVSKCDSVPTMPAASAVQDPSSHPRPARPDQHRHRAALALHLVCAAFPAEHTNPDAWPASAWLLPHALAVTSHAEVFGLEPALAASLLNWGNFWEAAVWATIRCSRRFSQAPRPAQQEVVPALVEVEVPVPHLGPAVW